MATPLTDISDTPENTVKRLLVNQLLWMLLLRVVLYTLLLGVSAYLQSGQFDIIVLPPTLLLFFIIFIYIASICSGLILLNTDVNPNKFGRFQNLLDTLFVATLICLTGGSQSIFSPVFFFPIIAGGLIMPRLGGLFAAGASTCLYGTILTLEYYQLFPDFLYASFSGKESDALALINLFAVYGLTFFLAATLSSLFARRLRKTEDALSDSVRDFDELTLLYQQIFDDITTGIITTNNQNQITSANNAVTRITGYLLDDLLNKDFNSIFPNVYFTNSGSRHSAELQRKDARHIYIGYSYAKLQYKQLKDTENTSKNSTDCTNCKVITIQDISEVRRLEQQMRQAEKLAAIGRMSAGIAHDFRNPLTAIYGSAQVLANEFNLHPSSHHLEDSELINIILRESNRLSNTVSDFLKFARPEHAEKDWFSLNRCLTEVIEVAQADPAWPANITIERDTTHIVDIWADHYQLFTIFNHLLQNALFFCPKENGKIRIAAKEVKEEDDKIEVTVEDNGPGIPPDRIEKVFEPFYTKRVDGTGLGLAIVKQMMEEHEGSIQVDTSPLGGARLTLSFPLPREG
ncbi:MAG: PAS domain S-box protein [Desulfocapsa sp.]|nr:PAS domain S-box protein [Desulfocapsa sp.]